MRISNWVGVFFLVVTLSPILFFAPSGAEYEWKPAGIETTNAIIIYDSLGVMKELPLTILEATLKTVRMHGFSFRFSGDTLFLTQRAYEKSQEIWVKQKEVENE